MSDELKPCQRCGSEKLSIEFDELFNEPFYVLCKKCGAKSAMCETEDIAIENWNTRPIEDALRARAEKAEEKLEQLERQIVWQGDETTKENARLSSAINHHRKRANDAEAMVSKLLEIVKPIVEFYRDDSRWCSWIGMHYDELDEVIKEWEER